MADETPKSERAFGWPKDTVKAVMALMLLSLLLFQGVAMILIPELRSVEMGTSIGVTMAFTMSVVKDYFTKDPK